jgi:hypothetical protein
MFASLKGGAVRARRSLPKLSAILVVAAAAWPIAANATVETVPMGPSPTSASQAGAPPAALDLRSPDARDAGRVAAATSVQDLRSPDTRDAAAGLSVATPASHAAPSVSDGFEWGDAGIGAAVMLALLSLAAGTVLLTVRGRRHPA